MQMQILIRHDNFSTERYELQIQEVLLRLQEKETPSFFRIRS